MCPTYKQLATKLLDQNFWQIAAELQNIRVQIQESLEDGSGFLQ